MRSQPIQMLVLLALAAGVWGAPAAAHEFWLTPSADRAAPGDTITIRAWSGIGLAGEALPYVPERVARFELHAARRFDLATLSAAGDSVFARFVAADSGGALVTYQSHFNFLETSGPAFDRYLEEDGLDAARRARAGNAGPGREHYARCCKTWIAGSDVERWREPRGLTYEIVPLDDPQHNTRLRIQVLFEGRPLRGALVRAWSAAGDSSTATLPVCAVRSDSLGLATLDVGRPGAWLVSTVHMRPSSARGVDWESWWSSLTFRRATP